MRTKKNVITWGEFGSRLLFLAFPIAIQNLLSTTASMVDTVMIGSMSELSVAAVGICSQIGSLMFSLYFGFVSGAVLFLTQYRGAKDHKGFNRVVGYSLVFAGGIGVLFGIVNVLFPEFVLGVYTDKTEIIKLAIPYLRIVGITFPLQVFAAIVSIMLKSTERVKVPLVASMVSVMVNFIVNYTLIYGRFGMPQMGVTGAAIGTLLSCIVNLLILLIFLLRDRKAMSLNVRDMCSFDKKFTKQYFVKLLPILMNEIFYGVGQTVVNVVMGHQDESAIAAMAAFRVCEGFVYAFFGGLANATSVVVGNEIGAGRLRRGHSFAMRSTLVCPLVTFVIVGICFIFHNPLFTLFGLEAQAINYGKYMLLIYLFFATVRTCCYIMNECFRTGGETMYGTVLELCGLYLLVVPATWITGMVLKLPFLAVFVFVYTDEIIRLVAMLPYMRRGKWIKPMTEQGRANLEEFREMMKRK